MAGANERFIFQSIGFELGQGYVAGSVGVCVGAFVEIQMGVRMITDAVPSTIPSGDQLSSGVAIYSLAHHEED